MMHRLPVNSSDGFATDFKSGGVAGLSCVGRQPRKQIAPGVFHSTSQRRFRAVMPHVGASGVAHFCRHGGAGSAAGRAGTSACNVGAVGHYECPCVFGGTGRGQRLCWRGCRSLVVIVARALTPALARVPLPNRAVQLAACATWYRGVLFSHKLNAGAVGDAHHQHGARGGGDGPCPPKEVRDDGCHQPFHHAAAVAVHTSVGPKAGAWCRGAARTAHRSRVPSWWPAERTPECCTVPPIDARHRSTPGKWPLTPGRESMLLLSCRRRAR